MTLPFPLNQARPTEWLMRVTDSQPPYAVIRRLLKGDPNHPEEWFRVVKCAYESWRHHMAASRVDGAEMARRQPPAAELVKFYRERAKPVDTPR